MKSPSSSFGSVQLGPPSKRSPPVPFAVVVVEAPDAPPAPVVDSRVFVDVGGRSELGAHASGATKPADTATKIQDPVRKRITPILEERAHPRRSRVPERRPDESEPATQAITMPA